MWIEKDDRGDPAGILRGSVTNYVAAAAMIASSVAVVANARRLA